MKRFGYHSGQDIIYDVWLILSADPLSVRLTAGYPALKRNERAMNLAIRLPKAVFEAPSLKASIEVAEPSLPVAIDTHAVATAVRQAIGMDVEVTVRSEEATDAI